VLELDEDAEGEASFDGWSRTCPLAEEPRDCPFGLLEGLSAEVDVLWNLERKDWKLSTMS
jgi:hypothetical protein